MDSIGTPLGESGFAERSLLRIRSMLKWTVLAMTPYVELSLWKNHIYAAVKLNLANPPPGVLRPELWHCTLCRVWTDEFSMVACSAYFPAWEKILNGLLQMHLLKYYEPNGSILTHVGIPPWRRSWTFGVRQVMQAPFAALAEATASLVTGCAHITDPTRDVVITKQHELHISWH